MEFDSLRNAILRVLQVYIKEVTLESTFREDLGADSIDMVQIMRLVEEDLNITLPDGDLDKIVTVKDALDVIRKVTGNE